jgi:hypothetical protein
LIVYIVKYRRKEERRWGEAWEPLALERRPNWRGKHNSGSGKQKVRDSMIYGEAGTLRGSSKQITVIKSISGLTPKGYFRLWMLTRHKILHFPIMKGGG